MQEYIGMARGALGRNCNLFAKGKECKTTPHKNTLPSTGGRLFIRQGIYCVPVALLPGKQ